jgi:hypothetical protein
MKFIFREGLNLFHGGTNLLLFSYEFEALMN